MHRNHGSPDSTGIKRGTKMPRRRRGTPAGASGLPGDGSQTLRLIRSHLLNLHGYQPILPPEVLEDEGIAPNGIIKLDGNENPYGCSPRVQLALGSYSAYHIYPDPDQRELRRALKDYAGVPEENILVGSGSDELIDLILRLFLEPGDRVINCVPTFGMYRFCTEVCGGVEVAVPRDSHYAVDIKAVKNALDSRTKVIILASPNNPTGNVTPKEDILELLSTGAVVVMDEAYQEFSGVTVAPLVPQYENLVVLRSLSKWAGLAGLRVGYGVFPVQMVSYLRLIKQPYNVTTAAQIAALESLADLDYLRGRIEAILRERERLAGLLRGLDFLEPMPSEANFILCAVKRGEAAHIHQELRRRGILIRYFDTPLLRRFIRISVGKPEETDILIKALKEIGKEL